MWTNISNWFKKLAYEEYELTVWFKDKEEIIDGRKIHTTSKKDFKLSLLIKNSYISLVHVLYDQEMQHCFVDY